MATLCALGSSPKPGPSQAEPGQEAASLNDSLLEGRWSLSDSLFHTPEGGVRGPGQRALTAFGVKSSQGQRANNEDAYFIQDRLSTPLASYAEKLAAAACGSPSSPEASPAPIASSSPLAAASDNASIEVPFLPEDLSFYGVWDGHGGREVAQHCAERMHRNFACQLSLRRFQGSGGSGGLDAANSPTGQSPPGNLPVIDSSNCTTEDPSRQPSDSSDSSSSGVLNDSPFGTLPGIRAVQRMMETAKSDSPSALAALQNLTLDNSMYHPQVITDALVATFQKTDQELAGTEAGDYVGATAVVAVVGKEHIWVAHCGDSRAVIQRNGEAVAVTKDHKPDREDEAARVRAAGGRIVFNSGSYRIMGMLAMSRAIGDHFLRPYVIAEPEVAVLERTKDDEVLVIATDGLWDVFSCKEATNLAVRCIKRSMERGMSRHGACRVAASVLTKVALERGSRDNITVIVIDITLPAVTHSAPENMDSRVPSSAQSTSRGENGGKLSKTSSFSVGTYYFLKSQTNQQAQRHLERQNSAPNNPDGDEEGASKPAQHAGASSSGLHHQPRALHHAGHHGGPHPLQPPSPVAEGSEESPFSQASTSSSAGSAGTSPRQPLASRLITRVSETEEELAMAAAEAARQAVEESAAATECCDAAAAVSVTAEPAGCCASSSVAGGAA